MGRRAALGASLGTLLEYFDFAIFGLLSAAVFPAVFFHEMSGASALLASFATFGVAFVARPLGAVAFAAMGDRVGRRKVLIITLLMMGIATGLVGVLPSYAQVGILAPVLLVVLRFVQGLAAGGELTGAQLLALEHAPKQRRGRAGSFVAIASPLAQVLATLTLAGLTAAMSDDTFVSWGWRVPLVASLVLLAFAAWVRSRVDETPEFTAAQQRTEERPGALRVFRVHRRTVVLLLLAWAAPHCLYTMVSVFGISYMTSAGGLSKSVTFVIFVVAQVVAVGGALLGGRITDRIGPRNTVLIALIGLGVFFAPLFPLVRTGNVIVIAVFTAGALASVIFAMAAQASFFADSFPVRMRYMGSSTAYTGSSVLFAGTAPFAATGLLQLAGGNIAAVIGYGMVLVIVSVVAVLALPPHPEMAPEVDGT